MRPRRALTLAGLFASFVSRLVLATESSPIEVTDDSWDEMVGDAPLVLAGFFAPWCAHCKAMKPHWTEVAAHFHGEEIQGAEEEPLKVVSLDVVANPNVYWKQDIASYPTLRLFRRGASLGDCGERDARGVVAWAEAARSRLRVPSMNLEGETLKGTATAASRAALDGAFARLTEEDKKRGGLGVALVGLFGPTGGGLSALEDAFQSLAAAQHVDLADDSGPPPPPFRVISEPMNELRKSLGLTSGENAVLLLRPFDGPHDALESDAGLKELQLAAIATEASLFGPESQAKAQTQPVAVVVSQDLTDSRAEEIASSQAASSSRSHARFVSLLGEWIDEARWPWTLEWSAANRNLLFTPRPGFETHVLLLLPPQDPAGGEEKGAQSNAVMKEALRRAAQTRGPGSALFIEVTWQEGGDTAGLVESLGLGVEMLPSAVVVKSSAREQKVTFFKRKDPEGVLEDDEIPPFHDGAAFESFVADVFSGKVEGESPHESPAPREPAEEEKEDDVIDEIWVAVLEDEDAFDALIENQGTLSLVEFYAPWCGHCRKLKPAYAEAAAALAASLQAGAVSSGPAVVLAKADATSPEMKPLAEKLGVQGYPSLFVAHGGAVFPYSGPRDAEGIVRSLKGAASDLGGGCLSVTEAPEVTELLGEKQDAIFALLLIPPGEVSAEDFRAFELLCLRLALQVPPADLGGRVAKCARVSGNALTALVDQGVIPAGAAPAMADAKKPALAMLKTAKASSAVSPPGLLSTPPPGGSFFSAEYGSALGLDFVRRSARPGVVAFGSNPAFEGAMKAHWVRQVLLFDDFAPDTPDAKIDQVLSFAVEALEPQLEPLALAFEKRIVFVLVNSGASEALGYFGLDANQLPAARFVDVENQRSFLVPLPPELPLGSFALPGGLSSALVAALHEAVELGLRAEGNALEPVLRSEAEEVSTVGSEPLGKIVSSQWAKIVGESSAASLVLFYDPDCGHCQKMLPEVDALAKDKAKDNAAPFFRLDVTANDPFGDGSWEMPQGVPAVRVYKEGKVVAMYEGPPDRKALGEFLAEHAK